MQPATHPPRWFPRFLPMSRTATLFARLITTIACLAIASPARAQQATLAGTVLADSTERPLVNAEVAIAALKLTALTDSAGNFALRRVPAGTYQVVVRAVGRVPYRETMSFGANERIERDFVLKRAATTLAEVEVKEKAVPVDMRLAAFEERRKLGTGKFITQDVLEKTEGRKLGDVLRSRIAGLRPITVGSGAAMVSMRGPSLRMPSGDASDRRQGAMAQCYVQVIIDGMIRYRSQPDEKLFDINSIAPDQLAGVEYYTQSSTPLQYRSPGTTCGTLIIWTRTRY
jgi:hypothetical protein